MGFGNATLYFTSSSETGIVRINLGPNTQMPVIYTIYYRPNAGAAWVSDTATETSTYNNEAYFTATQELNGAQYYVKVENTVGSATYSITSGILTISDTSDT